MLNGFEHMEGGLTRVGGCCSFIVFFFRFSGFPVFPATRGPLPMSGWPARRMGGGFIAKPTAAGAST
jgi:hypothetical protein